MKLKKVLFVTAVIFGLNTNTYAQETPKQEIQISPPYGSFLDTQQFDIAIRLPMDIQPQLFAPNSPYQLTAMINGKDATEWLRKCIDQYRLMSYGEFFVLCKKPNNSAFRTNDLNQLSIAVVNEGTTLHEGSAHYYFDASERFYHSLPHNLTLQGNSVHREANIRLTAGQRVLITATGQVNVWPSNTSFPIATPKGNSNYCNFAHCTLPGAPLGALLAKVGTDGHWVLIGDNRVFSAYRSGDLIFGINDKQTAADLNDNIGSYDISLKAY